jgi:molecular chaperone DnaK
MPLIIDNLKEWSTIQTMMAERLSQFLEELLPEIGGDKWWKYYVLNQLSAHQQTVVINVSPGNLRAFDLAALIRITDRNWSELVIKRSFSRDTKTLLKELMIARNRYAHISADGSSLDDLIRDTDTARRVLIAIGTEKNVVEIINKIHQRLIHHLSSSFVNDTVEPTPEQIINNPRSRDGLASTLQKSSTSPNVEKNEEISEDEDIESVTDVDQTSGAWIIDSSSQKTDINRALATRTYVGIDFGTSTSVVSIVGFSDIGGLRAHTLEIDQPEEMGGTISHHLVNSVIALKGDRLLFGQDAFRLRQHLFEGRHVFSSFKMRLGIDVGPTYPETALRKGKQSQVIETAKDATRVFFSYLSEGIQKSIIKAGLPEEICVTVTVPASFEANQRRDLVDCLNLAGLSVEENCLIDEPNAAFLSFLHASALGETDRSLLDLICLQTTNILVYDFGAGTCDVSILEFRIQGDKITSRNRAISRFTALGGDDFDRAIAKNILLPRLLASAPDFEPTQRDIDERLIPRLQPTAERLKIAAIEWLNDRGIETLSDIRALSSTRFTEHSVPPISIRNQVLVLKSPEMSLPDFADAMAPLTGRYDPAVSTAHVYSPVEDSLSKSGLGSDELHAVLFVGGSALNPVVRHSVMEHLPKSVRAVVPQDLRTHVSVGAALHCFGFNAFGFDFIRPVTSEPVLVITRGGLLETLVPSGAHVPTAERFTVKLQVDRDGQHVVELPICVTSENKLLGLLRVESSNPSGFRKSEEVIVSASIGHDKLLDIEARISGIIVEIALLNPLSNSELSNTEILMLEAKQVFNMELLNSNGRPPIKAVLDYANAAFEAGAYEVAADLFVAAERLDDAYDFGIKITYSYYRAGRQELSKKWAIRAHDRTPTAISAYNLSCDASGDRRMALLRESLDHDPEYPPALVGLGRMLQESNNDLGPAMLEKAVSLLETELDEHSITKEECETLIYVAELIGKRNTVEKTKARFEMLSEQQSNSSREVFNEYNLAASSKDKFMTKAGE